MTFRRVLLLVRSGESPDCCIDNQPAPIYIQRPTCTVSIASAAVNVPKKCVITMTCPCWLACSVADSQAADGGLSRRLACGDTSMGATGCAATNKAVHEQEEDDTLLPRPNKATTPLYPRGIEGCNHRCLQQAQYMS